MVAAPPTFSARWKYRLPSQYKIEDIDAFLIAHYNYSCVEQFMLDPKYERCIHHVLFSKVAGIEHILALKKKQKPASGASEYSESPMIGYTPDSEKFVI